MNIYFPRRKHRRLTASEGVKNISIVPALALVSQVHTSAVVLHALKNGVVVVGGCSSAKRRLAIGVAGGYYVEDNILPCLVEAAAHRPNAAADLQVHLGWERPQAGCLGFHTDAYEV